jgi:glucosamine-6-phosphate deaminase
MPTHFPDYLGIPANRLGKGSGVQVVVAGTAEQLAEHMARAMLDVVTAVKQEGKRPALIVPVGPVDQFSILATQINGTRADWSDVLLVNMDEYLTADDRWVDPSHPLSFRGYMDRLFYDQLDADLAPRPENRLFPDPADPENVQRRIDEHGGIDACFGGIGINGHVAFNEPPEPGEETTDVEFADRPTRVLDLSRETRTINAVTVGGGLEAIPHRAVTVGMRETLAAKRLRFYCNRPWQSAVVRRVLHGPVTAACPASFLRHHADAEIVVADNVAAPPEIALR